MLLCMSILPVPLLLMEGDVTTRPMEVSSNESPGGNNRVYATNNPSFQPMKCHDSWSLSSISGYAQACSTTNTILLSCRIAYNSSTLRSVNFFNSHFIFNNCICPSTDFSATLLSLLRGDFFRDRRIWYRIKHRVGTPAQ